MGGVLTVDAQIAGGFTCKVRIVGGLGVEANLWWIRGRFKVSNVGY